MSTNPPSESVSPLCQTTPQFNSASPGNHTTSTSSSERVVPRALLSDSSNTLPPNRSFVTSSSNIGYTPRSGSLPTDTMTGIETGPGPLRHPKPLTAVDLYSQLEKEQEAVVNRLTRELSLLRAAQNASVVSSASSTSASGLPESSDYNASGFLLGHSHPTSSHFHRHRSSSVASGRSIVLGNSVPATGCLAADRGSGRTGLPPRHNASHSTTHLSSGGNSMSRQNSGSRANFQHQNYSGGSSPINMPVHPNNYYPLHGRDSWPNMHPSCSSRPASFRDLSSRGSGTIGLGCEKETPMSSRFDELALYRIELENVKKENEMLKRRLRELEALLNQKKQAENDEITVSYGNINPGTIETSSVHSKVKAEDDSGGVRLAQSTGIEDNVTN